MPSFPSFDPSPAPPFGDLRAVMIHRLKRWGLRTGLWGLGLFLLSLWAPALKFLFILWLIFAVAAGAFILLGARFLRRLQTGGVFFATSAAPSGLDRDEEPPPWAGRQSRRESEGEVIEVEAEVLPPPPGADRR